MSKLIMDAKCTRLLKETSRTFLVPIMRMPGDLRDAVGSAYLCLRAIDEIEDHSALDPNVKIELLNGIAEIFRSTNGKLDVARFEKLFNQQPSTLPEVTESIAELAVLAPEEVSRNVYDVTAEMAEAMAIWVDRNWRVETEADLDQYTFDVAGRVGLLLSDLWHWHDGTVCDEELSIGFGRALQAVNIVRNREEDLKRGIDFFPDGWDSDQLMRYARDKMELADEYISRLSDGSVYEFCIIPLQLAKATLGVIEAGGEKLSRQDVEKIIADLELEEEE